MISSWSVSNFKSIRERVSLDFAPLTLFAGQNSAGKSTLIQNILLTAQTLQSSVVSRSVILNGRIARLGTFSDIHSNSALTPTIGVKFELTSPKYGEGDANPRHSRFYYAGGDYLRTMSAIRCSYTFSAGTKEQEREALQLQPRLEGGTVGFISSSPDTESFEFTFSRHGEPLAQVLQRLGVGDAAVAGIGATALDYRVTSGLQDFVGSSRYYPGPRYATQGGVVLRHFLPVGLAVAFDKVAEQVESTYEVLFEPNSRYRYGTWGEPSSEMLRNPSLQSIYITAVEKVITETQTYSSRSLQLALQGLKHDFTVQKVSQLLEKMSAPQRKALGQDLATQEGSLKSMLQNNRLSQRELTVVPGPGPLGFSSEYITTFFSERVRYLGPLRDEPKPVYPLSGHNDPNDVGFRGEHTAAVLETHRNTEIRFVASDGFPFKNAEDVELRTSALAYAVNDWLAYMGIGDRFTTTDKGKLGHELKIATSHGSELHDLTHVGVGVSQALPIVVLSLLAEPGSTLIFEQPELHLHPRVQTRLADFFVSLIYAGKQCIVETHSEYLVSRLRFLAAVSESTDVASNIKMYFVEKESDQSVYREVEMTNRGVIKNWPVGFFDETERNASAILEAQLAKASKKRTGKE